MQPSLQAALGYAFGHAEANLVARPPTAFEAETLQLDPGEWIVQVLPRQLLVERHPHPYVGNRLRGQPACLSHRPSRWPRRVLGRVSRIR
jgi:hypothetical protein